MDSRRSYVQHLRRLLNGDEILDVYLGCHYVMPDHAEPGREVDLSIAHAPGTHGNFRETLGVRGRRVSGSAMAILPENVRTESIHARLRQIFFKLVEVASLTAKQRKSTESDLLSATPPIHQR